MKFKALVTAEILPEILAPLADRVDFTYDGYHLDHVVMPHEELIAKIPAYDILVCEYDTIDKAVLDAATNLKFIVCCRGGVKTVIDLDYAKEKGVTVCNNAGRNARAVADITLGFILDMTRNITRSSSAIRNRVITMDQSTKPKEYRDTVWGLDNDSPFIRFRGRSVNYMTLGLVGFGHVGRLVADRARAFGMKIIAFDPYVKQETVPGDVEIVSFDDLLARADVITLHCAQTAENKNMFSAEVFSRMKKGSYFINTARGGLVDETALVAALESEHLAGAALDVTAVEPIAPDSPLVDAKNLLVTPHIAGSSFDVQMTGSRMVLEYLGAWLDGTRPGNCVVYCPKA